MTLSSAAWIVRFGERQRVERRLHVQPDLVLERGNLLRHGVALRARLRDAAGRAPAVEQRHLRR